MTNPYARPAEPPEDASADSTIPLVPEFGYTQPRQPAFEDTLAEPAPNPWPQPPAQSFGSSPNPASQPSKAQYWPDRGAASSGPTGPGHPQPYQQPVYGQPVAGYTQTGQQPGNYTQPTYTPPPPAGFAEPSGPAETIRQSGYQTYQGSSQLPAVPAPAPYGYGYHSEAPDHPNATVSFVLGLIGLFLFPPLCPVAWYLGAKGQRDVKANPGQWRSGGLLTAGTVLGIIGTVVLALIAVTIFFLIVVLAAASR